MDMKSAADKIQLLEELKNLLKNTFSDKIDKVVLYGSQALETSNEYSDYDILVILDTAQDWQLETEILNLCFEIDLKYGILTDVQFVYQDELNTVVGKQPYIVNALEHGVMV